MKRRVRSGLSRLISDERSLVRGRRVGLLCHHASFTDDLEFAPHALERAGAQITRLFGPEHESLSAIHINIAKFVPFWYFSKFYSQTNFVFPSSYTAYSTLSINCANLGVNLLLNHRRAEFF